MGRGLVLDLNEEKGPIRRGEGGGLVLDLNEEKGPIWRGEKGPSFRFIGGERTYMEEREGD